MAKILIVEDDSALREVFSMIVASGGHVVDVAQDGSEALERLQTVKPDMILLDMLMPIKSGIEFLQEADVKRTFPDCIVIVLSNLSESQTIDHALKLGAVKHIIKSDIEPQDLLKEIDIYLS